MAKPTKLTTIAPKPPAITLHDTKKKDVSFVRFGLYDSAFDVVTPGTSPILRNSDVDETLNFVGMDSRRFFIRIHDPNLVAPGATTKRFISADWFTVGKDKVTVVDNNDSVARVALEEDAPGSGTFESPWLLLVSDHWEVENVTTTTGSPGHGMRQRGEANFRLRFATIFDHVAVRYPQKGGAIALFPIFERSPEERRTIPLQLFVLAPFFSDAFGRYILDQDLKNMRGVYARVGYHVKTVTDAALEEKGTKFTHKGESLLVVPVPPGLGDAANLGISQQLALGHAYPGLIGDESGKTPFPGEKNPTDTLRVFFAANVLDEDGASVNGISHPDVFVDPKPADEAYRGAVFVADGLAKVNSGVGSAMTHEAGHVLTNHRKGHYVEPTPPIQGDKFLFQAPNLMCAGPLAFGTGIASSQRIWDHADGDGVDSYAAIRTSRYTRAGLT